MTVHDLVEKFRRFPVPSICGVIVVVCFLAYYLRMDLLTDLEVESDDVKRQLQQIEQNISHGRSLPADIAEMKRSIEELDSRLIRSAELATNLKYFYELEVTTHVTMTDLRQMATAPVSGSGKPILAGVGYSMLMSGSFHQLVAYLNELDHGRHFYRLQSVALQRVERGADSEKIAAAPLSASLNVELLAWP